MQRTKWTPEQKADALRLLAEVGKAEAARLTGIPAGTIASWGARTGTSAPSCEEQRPAVQARQMTMARRKTAFAEKLMTTAEKLLKRVDGKNADALDVKRLMDAIGTAVEKAQLLAGDVTSRLGMVEPVVAPAQPQAPAAERERALAAVSQLAERRAS